VTRGSERVKDKKLFEKSSFLYALYEYGLFFQIICYSTVKAVVTYRITSTLYLILYENASWWKECTCKRRRRDVSLKRNKNFLDIFMTLVFLCYCIYLFFVSFCYRISSYWYVKVSRKGTNKQLRCETWRGTLAATKSRLRAIGSAFVKRAISDTEIVYIFTNRARRWEILPIADPLLNVQLLRCP